MKRAVAASLALALVAAGACFHKTKPPGFTTQETFGPYLQSVSGTGATVCWRTSVASDSLVEYGTTPQLGQRALSGQASEKHEIALSGLVPGTAYFYRATSRDANGQIVFQKSGGPFSTAISRADGLAGKKFTFLAMGENHNHSLVSNFSSVVAASGASFVVDAADQVDAGSDLGDWRTYFDAGKSFYHALPLYMCFSNHNYSDDAGWGYFDIVANPGPTEQWYTFEWGHVQFFAIDSTYNKGGNEQKIRDEELPWLERELARATDGVDDPVFTVAFYHHPTMSSGPRSRWMDRVWGENVLLPILEKYGVDLVLYAHDKFYERSVRNGVPYIQIATGKLAPTIENKNPYSVKLITTQRTILVVDVEGRKMAYRAVNEQGTVLDSGEVRR
ncbi:MAG: metallophosphoesterase family protein [Planctomycetes bacterium]|nr:metallophosphoesterase family protein [Planctomycetota bacterium]